MRGISALYRPQLLPLLLLLLLPGRTGAREDINLDELDPDMDRDIFRYVGGYGLRCDPVGHLGTRREILG